MNSSVINPTLVPELTSGNTLHIHDTVPILLCQSQLSKATIAALHQANLKTNIMASPNGINTGHGSVLETSRPSVSSELDLPSVDQVLSGLPDISSILPVQDATVDLKDQEAMFRALKNIIEHAEQTSEVGNSFDLKELHASLGQAEEEARLGRRDATTLESVHTTLVQLWSCNSTLMAQAAEILANGSRDRKF